MAVFNDITEVQFAALFATHAKGAVFLTQACCRGLRMVGLPPYMAKELDGADWRCCTYR